MAIESESGEQTAVQVSEPLAADADAAESTMQESEPAGSGCDSESTGSGYDVFGIPNTPKGTASAEEYRHSMHAMNGISLIFGRGVLKRLGRSKEEETMPIGMRLLKDRSSLTDGESQEESIDYYAEHKQVEEVAKQLERALLQDTKHRRWKRRKREPLKDVAIANNTSAKKRKLCVVSAAEARHPKIECCVHGCTSNNFLGSQTILRLCL